MDRPLLILDLDETLVHASERELTGVAFFRASKYFVYCRPHLETFLDACFADFEVALWTSAGRGYAEKVVSTIIGTRSLRFFWCGDRCVQRVDFRTYTPYTVKDLRKVRRLGFAIERILMVDDSPEKLERNYGNHIRVDPFEGEPSDCELPLLARYLQQIRDQPNYRVIEKRHWRRLAAGSEAPSA